MRTEGIVFRCAVGVLVILFHSSSRGEKPNPHVGGEAKTPMCRCVGVANEAMARIEETLASPLKPPGLDFTEEPLQNVVSFLQSEYEIPIQLDVPALEDAGLTPSEKVTVTLRSITLRSALRLLLKQKQLTYVTCNEVLIITTPEEAEAELVVCVYDVRDLIGKSNGLKQLQSIVEMISSCVAMETWAKNGGGEAQIKALQPGLLVISQTQAVHEQIGDLLRAIRETLRQANVADHERETGTSNDALFGGEGSNSDGGYGRGGYGMEGGEMGMEGRARGMERGRGGYGGGYGGRGGDTQPEPTPAEGMNPFD